MPELPFEREIPEEEYQMWKRRIEVEGYGMFSPRVDPLTTIKEFGNIPRPVMLRLFYEKILPPLPWED